MDVDRDLAITLGRIEQGLTAIGQVVALADQLLGLTKRIERTAETLTGGCLTIRARRAVPVAVCDGTGPIAALAAVGLRRRRVDHRRHGQVDRDRITPVAFGAHGLAAAATQQHPQQTEAFHVLHLKRFERFP
jgi:hypothetical protein